MLKSFKITCRQWCWAVCLAAQVSGLSASEVDPHKEYRVALVIGNSAYQTAPLKNPVNDAKDIASTLQELGFEVVLGLDLDKQQVQEKIDAFSPLLARADVGFFYFAGHGFQYQGDNYLVPLAFDIRSESDIPRESISTQSILKKMDKAGNAINIVILDACRNNPFADVAQSRTRSMQISSKFLSDSTVSDRSRGIMRTSGIASGLSRLNGPSGSFIAYATAPGNVAADGNGKNGLYTLHLLNFIDQPGLSIEQVFKKVRIAVIKDTKGRQVPWENSSLLGDFYFVPEDSAVSKSLGIDFLGNNQAVDKLDEKLKQEQKQRQLQLQAELKFWSSVENSQLPELYQAYLDKYPEGHFVEIATIKLQLALAARQAQTQQAASANTEEKTPVAKEAVAQPLPEGIVSALSEAVSVAKKQIEQKQQQRKRQAEMGLPLKADDFVTIRAGCFTMGSPFAEEGRQNDELDHKVCISKDFKIAKYEVTQALWTAVMGNNPAYFKACGKDCPIENISWNDIQTFLFRLNLMTEGGYRLPTEAEWEYAARAGTQTATYQGDPEWLGSNNVPDLNKIAWYSGNSKVKYKGGKYCEDWDDKQFPAVRCGTHPVGRKKPNRWGLYDMLGNVWEFTNDWYAHFSSAPQTDPKGPASGDMKVAKGGNWADALRQNRAAARYGFAVKERVNNLGFRLVRDL